MIVLVGESASGKSTVERKLCDIYGYKRIISYTTRPMRTNESNGVDYHFITKEEFLKLKDKDYFAELTQYRDWYYGTAKEDCTQEKIIVANPHGLRQLKRLFNSQVKSFYMNLSERERLIRLLKRGDDILECFRRVISDQGVFQNIEEDCDMVISCENSTPEALAEIIHTVMNGSGK